MDHGTSSAAGASRRTISPSSPADPRPAILITASSAGASPSPAIRSSSSTSGPKRPAFRFPSSPTFPGWASPEKASQPRWKRTRKPLFGVRDKIVEFLNANLPKGDLTGGRRGPLGPGTLLREAGYEDALRHRTGHGIDIENHGSGVNLDSVEFPDPRFFWRVPCFPLNREYTSKTTGSGRRSTSTSGTARPSFPAARPSAAS